MALEGLMPWLKAIVAQRFLFLTLLGPMASSATFKAFRVLGGSATSFVAFSPMLALEEGFTHLLWDMFQADKMSGDKETAAFVFSKLV